MVNFSVTVEKKTQGENGCKRTMMKNNLSEKQTKTVLSGIFVSEGAVKSLKNSSLLLMENCH